MNGDIGKKKMRLGIMNDENFEKNDDFYYVGK